MPKDDDESRDVFEIEGRGPNPGEIFRNIGLAKTFRTIAERGVQLIGTAHGKTLENLLLNPFFKKAIKGCQRSWRKVVSAAVKKGIPVPAFSTALAFFDGIRSERLPANLLQAQRDYFGAHTYERVDKPRGEFFHTNWTGTGGRVASSTYTV